MKKLLLNTKKVTTVVLIVVFAIILTSCVTPNNKVLSSLGKYESSEYYTSGGFKDFTDYAKYRYSSVKTANNKYFKKISQTDLETINEYLNEFESWIETEKIRTLQTKLLLIIILTVKLLTQTIIFIFIQNNKNGTMEQLRLYISMFII